MAIVTLLPTHQETHHVLTCIPGAFFISAMSWPTCPAAMQISRIAEYFDIARPAPLRYRIILKSRAAPMAATKGVDRIKRLAIRYIILRIIGALDPAWTQCARTDVGSWRPARHCAWRQC